LFQEEIGLEDRSKWVKKRAIISTAGIIAFQRVKEAGMEEFMRNLLYQFQQSSKKIRNKEGIGKD
jgi:hypothetical protein